MVMILVVCFGVWCLLCLGFGLWFTRVFDLDCDFVSLWCWVFMLVIGFWWVVVDCCFGYDGVFITLGFFLLCFVAVVVL